MLPAGQAVHAAPEPALYVLEAHAAWMALKEGMHVHFRKLTSMKTAAWL